MGLDAPGTIAVDIALVVLILDKDPFDHGLVLGIVHARQLLDEALQT